MTDSAEQKIRNMLDSIIKDAIDKFPKFHAVCPHCGFVAERALTAGLDPKLPKANEIAVCYKCNNVTRFDADMKLQKVDLEKLTADELMEVSASMRVMAKFRERIERGKSRKWW